MFELIIQSFRISPVEVSPAIWDAPQVPALSKNHHRDPPLLAVGSTVRTARQGAVCSPTGLVPGIGVECRIVGGDGQP